jgi:folylpolyglutamate synthase
LFAKYFFEVWDRLEAASIAEGSAVDSPASKPAYFKFLTLMALHTYFKEKVDAAIIECGIGGEYDSTNILVHPSVTAVTSLGIDHVALLGPTIAQIAWQKAGIFKSGAPAFTVTQPAEAMDVLRQRAKEKSVPLYVVERHPELETLRLGLAGDFQKTNASLAIAVAATFLRAIGVLHIPDPTDGTPIILPIEFRRGLEQVSWPGRCDTRRENNISWHLDGGHTMESMELVGKWFADQISTSSSSSQKSARKRILIFNQQGKERNPEVLALRLNDVVQQALLSNGSLASPFTHAIFTTNVTFSSGYKPDLLSLNTNSSAVDSLDIQRSLAKAWEISNPSTHVQITGTIEQAINDTRKIASESGEEVMVLITGSLHLVGGALEVLEQK